MDILSLPLEIQEHILSFLDACSLVRCSKVCKLWHTLTEGCWQQCCKREIPSEVLVELLGFWPPLNSALPLQEPSVTWASLFLKWNHHAAITRSPHQTFSLPFRNISDSNRCIVRLSGDFLVLAPTVENVRVFKVHIYESGKCVGIIAKHNKSIQDITMMDFQRAGPYRIKGSQKFAEHDTVISISSDRNVQINELTCSGRRPLKLWEAFLTSDCLNASIRVFGHTMVVACQDRHLHIWNLTLTDQRRRVRVEEVCVLNSPFPITQTSVWKDHVICLWWNPPGVHLISWNLSLQVWTDNIYIADILTGPIISTFRSLIFSVGTQFTILKNSQFYQKYEHWEKIGRSTVVVEKITSLCLKRNILIVGTQAGEMYIFIVNHDNELRNLKMISPVNAIRITASPPSHQHLEIKNLDVSFDGQSIHIAAQTAHAIHLIRWFPVEKELRLKPTVELPVLSQYEKDDSCTFSDEEYWFYDSD